MFIRKDVVLAGILLCVGAAVSKQAEAKGFADDVREWNLLRFEQEKIKTRMEDIAGNSSVEAALSEDHISQKEEEFLDKLHTPNTDYVSAQATQVVGLASSLIRLGKHKSPLAKLAADDLRIESIFTKNLSKISKILNDSELAANLKFFSTSKFSPNGYYAKIFTSLPKRPSANVVEQYIFHINTIKRGLIKAELRELNYAKKVALDVLYDKFYAWYDFVYKIHNSYEAEFMEMLQDSAARYTAGNHMGVEGFQEYLENSAAGERVGLEGFQEITEDYIQKETQEITKALDKKYPPFVDFLDDAKTGVKISYSDHKAMNEFYARTEDRLKSIESGFVHRYKSLPNGHQAERTIRQLNQTIRNLQRYQTWSSAYGGGKRLAKFGNKIAPILGSTLGLAAFTELLFTDTLEASEAENPLIKAFAHRVTVKTEQLKSLFWAAYFENNAPAMDAIFATLTNPAYFKNVLDPVELLALEKSLDFKGAMCPTPDKRLEQIYQHPQVTQIIDNVVAQNKVLLEATGKKLANYYQVYLPENQRKQLGEPATLQLR